MTRASLAISAAGRERDELDELVRRAARRDREAQTAVLAAVAPRVLAAVRGVLGVHAADVDDVAQDSLIALLDALPNFRGDCPIASFACGVAVRTALRSRRRWLRRAPKHEQYGREQLDVEPAHGVDVQLDRARRLAVLRTLLGALPLPQAEALALRCILEADLPEIAAAAGVPVNTVRSRIRLAREALLQRIDADPSLRALFEVDHA
ncbi:MAG: RNA polymerase sigma factor [Nannocystaceae bacterium]|nr:RNA polymerase sigma factor [Nannocystaceae bacterium]